ncbi:MAG: tetratricopeptide repeat protein [Candidatus Omnitrophica bacterium]|nr:tetratricopeptide repeat protein [Candidatus Omnitrophota bacterium]
MSNPEQRTEWLGPGLICAIGILFYLTSFPGVFLADDGFSIVDNPNIRSLWPLSQAVSKPPIHDAPVRPLVYFTLALNYALGRLNPWGYHAFNLAVHIFAALALYGILRRTLQGSHYFTALSIALIWLVHPLQTQSVTYVIQRAESLMGLFYLLTLYCMIRGARARGRGIWYAMSVASCALGMATKPVMVTAPLAVLLYDRIFLVTSLREALRIRRGLYLSLAATWVILFFVLAASPQGPETSAGFTRDFTPLEYALNQPRVILQYLKLVLWPVPQCLDYVWAPADGAAGLLWPAAAVGFSLLASAWFFWRYPAWGFPALWFFLVLLPSSSFIPIDDLLVEHRMYLPLAGCATLAVLGGREFMRRVFSTAGLRKALSALMLTFIIGSLGFLTALRNTVYWSQERMFRDIVATRPANYRAHYALGRILYDRDRIGEAVAHYEEAIRLKPEFPFTYTSLGNAFLGAGRMDEALINFRKAIELNPGFAGGYNNLGSALARSGRVEEAISYFEKALELNPRDEVARENLEEAQRAILENKVAGSGVRGAGRVERE